VRLTFLSLESDRPTISSICNSPLQLVPSPVKSYPSCPQTPTQQQKRSIAEDAGLPFPDTTSTAPLSPAQDSEDLDQLSADIEDFAIDHNLTYEEAEEEPVPLLTPLPESEESGSAGVAEVFDWGSSGYRDGGSEVEGWEAEEGESDNQAELDLSSQTQAAGGWNAAEASVPGANWSYGRDGVGTDSWERELLQVGSDIP